MFVKVNEIIRRWSGLLTIISFIIAGYNIFRADSIEKKNKAFIEYHQNLSIYLNAINQNSDMALRELEKYNNNENKMLKDYLGTIRNNSGDAMTSLHVYDTYVITKK